LKSQDLKYAAGFIRKNLDAFADYLETEHEIDGSEAEPLLEELEAAADVLDMNQTEIRGS